MSGPTHRRGTELSGVQTLDMDAEQLRLEQIIRSGVAPGIPCVELGEPIPVSNGRSVFLIRIPRSGISPHMVTYQGTRSFTRETLRGNIRSTCKSFVQHFYFRKLLDDSRLLLVK